MKWINKNKGTNKRDAEKVVKEYLNKYCLKSDGRYHSIRYDDRDPGTGPSFCKAEAGSYRKRLTNILLNNQDGYCCYCMRKIKTAQHEEDSDEVVTREHIIPRGFTTANKSKVTDYYQQCPEMEEVILTDEFEDIAHSQVNDLPPYPHKVAYQNLVASCNGTFPYVRNDKQNKPKICCNEARHEKDAFPVYYFQDIESCIHYLPNGDIQIRASVSTDKQNEINDVITNAKLNCDELRDIRRLWYILSHVSKERIYNCRTEEQRNYLLSELLWKDEFYDESSADLHRCFVKDVFWATFMLYDYFYDYFQRLRLSSSPN